MLSTFERNFPEFRIEDNKLILEDFEGANMGSEDFLIIADQTTDNINYVYGLETYQDFVIVMLQDRIVIKNDVLNSMMGPINITYEELAYRHGVDTLDKETMISIVREGFNWIAIYAGVFVIGLIANFMAYGILTIMSVVLLMVVGMLTNFALKTGLKQSAVLNIVLHAITLPVILLVIYVGVRLLTGFEIRHFRMVYDAISYVYVITAMLLIRSNLQKELMRIVQVQKEVQAEGFEREEDGNTEKEEHEDEEKNTNKDVPDIAPEGGQAIKEQ